ncbi:MAG: hypothetical protein J2P23_10020 [Microlunatus sp.]|nr:hypothetical protein [Microlunatus sp.]
MKQTSQISRMAGKRGRIGAALATAGLLFALSACGFGVQTLQPYTPADGVNVNVAPGPDGQPDASTIKVRGLMILARTPTSGFLSATFDAQNTDTLTGITGNVLNPNGSTGDALTVNVSSPIKVGGGNPVVLVDHAAVTVTGNSLPAGQDASLTLTFANAGSEQVKVPIVDGNNDIYATVSPSAPATNG